MADFLTPAWFGENAGIFILFLIMLVVAYWTYNKNPFEKPVNHMIKLYGWDTFLNKSVAEIDAYLNENVDFSEKDLDYTSTELATEIYLRVNRMKRKDFDKEQGVKKSEAEIAEDNRLKWVNRFEKIKSFSKIMLIIGILVALIGYPIGQLLIIVFLPLLLLCIVLIKLKKPKQIMEEEE
ncbi:hypothetical protein MsAg5_11360 [Methanosarcinaceae archaeon Ag5]|uniref:Uncharacterized protein n=1 Tax=Methanolapillus africanus TaxID=3028297 RepID=A0AAE4MKG2_9EURY|nr:hypothetical protein [Methanosarcinaceae archaeon Ag5]